MARKDGGGTLPRGTPVPSRCHWINDRSFGSGRSSRLYDALVRRQQVATNVAGFNFGLADGADMLVFTATGKPGSNPDSLEVALLAELAGASSFTQGELERARASERFAFVN